MMTVFEALNPQTDEQQLCLVLSPTSNGSLSMNSDDDDDEEEEEEEEEDDVYIDSNLKSVANFD